MEHLRFDLVDRVFTATIDRPHKKNALTVAMYQALADGLRDADEDDRVRAVVICGSRETFTAGNDITDFVQRPPQDASHPVFQFLQTLTTFRKPIVGAVAGPAIGIGTTMLLHFDQVYAATNARFHLGFINLGLVVEGGSSVLLPRLVGYQKAAELTLFGEPFTAEAAHQMGIVREVVHPEQVLPKAHAAARALAQKPIGALMEIKRLLKEPFREELHAAIEREGALFIQRLSSPEAKEAFTAFMQKSATTPS